MNSSLSRPLFRLGATALFILLAPLSLAANGWVDISGNLPAGIDRGQTQLVAVHFLNDDEGWVCDSSLKAVYHTTDGGGTWTTIPMPAGSGTRAPVAIFMRSSTEGWIGCDDGRLYATSDGWTTWTGLFSANAWINDIEGVPGSATAIAVGEKGASFTLTATGATRFTLPELTLPTGNSLSAVSIPTADEAWITTTGGSGYEPLMYHRSGGTWAADQASYPAYGLLGVFMRTTEVGHLLCGQFDAGNQWMGPGVYSTIDGSTWYENINVPSTRVVKIGADGKSSVVTVNLNDVAFVSNDEGWIIGTSGWILHTTNGSATATAAHTGWTTHGSYSNADLALTVWSPDAEGLTELALNRVFFPSATAGYAVGTGDMVGGLSSLHHRGALFKRTALLGPADVTFVVTEGSAPVPGAIISFNGLSAQTNAAGRATIALPTASVPIEHRYTIEAPGLMSEMRYLALPANAATKTEAIEMRPVPGEFVRLSTEAPGVRTGFSLPQDVHVDASGNLWVLDVTASSVQQYNTAGALVSEWSLGLDSAYARKAVAEFERDASGNWYVLVRPHADWDRYGVAMPGEVRKYDASGSLLASWTGTPQTGPFSSVYCLALDNAGNVYLGTTRRGILKLDSSGDLLDRVGCGVMLDGNGNEVDGDGQMPLAWVTSLAVDSTGRIYAGEASGVDASTRAAGQSNYVTVYLAAGRFVARWGGSTEATNALFRGAVQSLVCDASDRVVALDPQANRVQTFSSTGAVESVWGSYGVDDGKLDGPCRMSRDPSGNLYLVEGAAAAVQLTVIRAKSRIQKFTATGSWQQTWTGTTATVDGSFDTPWGVGVASTGEVYVTDYDRNRVQKFSADGTFLLGFGASGTGDGQFNHPTGVAVDASGNVYVGDRYNDRVQVFSSGGTFLRKFGASGTSGLGNFCYVNSVAIGPDGNVYVGDQRSLQKFSTDGTALARWGSYGSGTGQFYSINGIGFDASGNIYTSELDNHRVQVFDSAGNFLRTWGQRGEDDGEFFYGFGLAFDAAGYLYVCDNSRVQGFTTAGDFVTRFGPNDGGAGEFLRPHGLARSPVTGALYLADTMTKALYRCPAPVISHRVSLCVGDRGQPLAGATVAINGVSVITDGAGVVSLWLPAGTYPFTVTCTDYASGSGSVVVGASSVVTEVALTRQVASGAAFTVANGAGTALANVKLLVDGTTLRYSDALGTALITGLSAASHTVVASAPGFVTQSKSFNVAFDGSATVPLVLVAAGSSAETIPTVTTGYMKTTMSTGGIVASTVNAEGGAAVTARGVVVSTSFNPTLATGTVVPNGSGSGNFWTRVEGLAANSSYHVRAYATNSVGTGYGDDLVLTTRPAAERWAPLAGPAAEGIYKRIHVAGGEAWLLSHEAIYHSSDFPAVALTSVHADADTGFNDLAISSDGGSRRGWAVGYSSLGARTTDAAAQTWTRMYLSGDSTFSCVSFPTAAIGYASGTDKALHKTTDGGATWNEVKDSLSVSSINTLVFTDPLTGYIGTSSPSFRKTTDGGLTWSSSNVGPVTGSITDLFFLDADHGWAVGPSDIVRLDAGTWKRVANPTGFSLQSVFFINPQEGWACGTDGGIAHSTDGGATWTVEESGTTTTLRDIFFVSTTEGYAVGNDGTILRYVPPAATIPTVTTGSVSSITTTTATVAGNVTADGGASVTARGVVYGSAANPTLATGTTVTAGSSTGSFSAGLTGLAAGTTYHVRAYATNSVGTSYGDDVAFSTSAVSSIPVIDTCAGIGFAGDTGAGGAATRAQIGEPTDLVVDSDGAVFVADAMNRKVWRIDPATGVITALVSLEAGTPTGLAFDSAGGLFLSIANAGVIDGFIKKVDKTTGALTTIADFGGNGCEPEALAIDATGRIYVADAGSHRYIRRWDPTTEQLSVLIDLGTAGHPYGLALDADGNVLVAMDQVVKRFAKDTWVETRFAGAGGHGYSGDDGPATAAGLWYPRSLAVDADGNVLIADWGNHRIRRVDRTTGVITTVAGNGGNDYSGEDAAASAASLSYPAGVAVDGSGRVWVADTGNAVIRRIAPGTPVSGATAAVVTGVATKIAPTRATVSGVVAGDGGSAITECGIVFATTANPTVGTASKVTATAASGRFAVDLTGLVKGTTYHVRAYAMNASGTAYGDDVVFTTTTIAGEWTRITAPAGATQVRAVFADDNKVWVLADNRIYYTADITTTPFTLQYETATGSMMDFCFRRIAGKWSAWAVGSGRTGVRTTDAEAGGWTAMSFSGNGNAQRVSFPTDTTGFLVDSGNLVMKTVDSGQTWTVIPLPSDYTQRIAVTGSNSMIFLDATTGYSVSSDPEIRTSTDAGATWTDSGASVGDALCSLWFRGSALGWAVGGGGQILRYAAGEWVDSLPNPDPDQRTLWAVHFSTDTDGWAVGNDGVMIHSIDSGLTWSLQDGGVTTALLDVFFVSPELGYAVGSNGTILRYAVAGEPPAATVPTVTTGAASSVTTTTATVAGNVTADGGASVTARGVVYGATANPTLATGTTVTAGSGTGGFSASLSGLAAGTTYHVRAYATNSAGSSYGAEATFTTASLPPPPPPPPTEAPHVTTGLVSSITASQASVAGNITDDGGASVTARGVVYAMTPNPTLTSGTVINAGIGTGAFSATLSGLAASTTYHVRAFATNGEGTSYGADVMFTTEASPSVGPTVLVQPLGSTVVAGQSATFSIAASGGETLRYCWQISRDGGVTWVDLTDGTGCNGCATPSLRLVGLRSDDGARLRCQVSDGEGHSSLSAAAELAVAAAPGRLITFTARGHSGPGHAVLILGVVTRVGVNGTGTLPLLIRGIGPTLAEFGVAGGLADPQLTVFAANGSAMMANDNWSTGISASAVAAATARLGVAPLPTGSADCAVMAGLAPAPVTMHVSGVGGAAGLVLVEAYDAAEPGCDPEGPRIVNGSVRGRVGTGDRVLVGGFVIGGESARRLLLRGIGPGLATLGVADVLVDPQLALYRGTDTLLLTNDDWGLASDPAAIAAAGKEVGAFALANGSHDAAILATLEPGIYSLVLTGAADTTGIGLIEIYDAGE